MACPSSITLPSLIITGRASNKPLLSQEWIQHRIPDAELVVFDANEGGEHFMFLENPDKFNQTIKAFLHE